MNINGYLFVINKNNSYKLNADDLKDVKQEIDIYMVGKSYNDLIMKKTVLSFYLKAVKQCINNENLVSELTYFDNSTNEFDEIKERRLNALKELNLNDTQKKIIALLIEGYKYKDIRKRLKMNTDKLTSHVKRIKKNNI